MFLPFENKSVKPKKKKFHMKILISVTEFSVSLRFHAQSRHPAVVSTVWPMGTVMMKTVL